MLDKYYLLSITYSFFTSRSSQSAYWGLLNRRESGLKPTNRTVRVFRLRMLIQNSESKLEKFGRFSIQLVS